MHTSSRTNRVRLLPEANTQPPAGATYFDQWTLMCSPCQSGSVNQCQTRAAPTGGGDFDWLLRTTQMAPVKECCTTATDAMGRLTTTCDMEQGCGWTAGPFLTDEMSCRFTTNGATYPTLETCVAENPGPVVTGDHKAWFPPCTDGNITDCYFPSTDACLPGVFGKMRAAQKPTTCQRYVCEGAMVESGGNMSFPAGACRCEPQ